MAASVVRQVRLPTTGHSASDAIQYGALLQQVECHESSTSGDIWTMGLTEKFLGLS
ncbi:MAG: hypothetical protein OJF51_002353 [Nitrospira sp.]|nr:MAG: hypothetical protein OJF51_002353 [Nitrospira sp.]